MIQKIWINCSEASGDLCAGALAKELLRQNPGLEINGLGGSMLSQAGANVHFSMNRICFTGFKDVLLGLPKIHRLHTEIKEFWKQHRPDIIIMIDCPDFNLPLIKEAHSLNIPVYYFIAPQFWAWKQCGIKTLRKYVQKIICALPFEPAYFQKRGCQAQYNGHPLQDIIPLESLDGLSPNSNQIGIMPGSRKKEISFLLPEFAKAAFKIHQEKPQMTFCIACAPGIHQAFLKKLWPANLPVQIVSPRHRFQMIRESNFILAASGTATLETALIGTPTLVAYKIDSPAAFILRKLAFSKFISLTNILFKEELFPEYLQEQAHAQNFHQQISTWLNSPQTLVKIRHQLREIRSLAGPAGGMHFAAKTILAH